MDILWLIIDRPSSTSSLGSLANSFLTLGHKPGPLVFSCATCGIFLTSPVSLSRLYWNVSGTQPNANNHSLIWVRSEEHTSELQSLMRISYAVFCLKKKKKKNI